MIDCLIIGYNDPDFVEYEKMIRSMGVDSGAYRDLNLAFIEYEGKPHRSMDILNRFYYEDKPAPHKLFHNADFLWPVIPCLGSYLHRRGFTFDYIKLFHLEKERLREKLLHEEIRTIAITTTVYVTAHPILEIISFIRQYNDKVKVIVGGPYIHNQSRMGDQITLHRFYKYLGADFYVISQEGEATLANLLGALKSGADLDSVANLAHRRNGGFIETPIVTESNELEENPIDYDLFPREDTGEFISLRTAKSCPFSCSFCGFPQRAGRYTYTGIDFAEKELNALAARGVRTLTFLDDTFNVPKKRFQDILRMMIANKYGFKWNSFYRSDHGDEETIELMAESGCEGVFLGVESGSDQMLERMNKTSRRKNYMTAIPLLQKAGISAHANVIIGFPGETYDTVEETVSLIEETRPDFFRAQLWYADPMTPIWNDRERYGVKGSMFNWSHNTMDCHTASELVEKLFLSVKNSVWLPQNGFEQWSVFYLQRKGMTMGQIKRFLRAFNAGVKQKLLDPNRTGISEDLVETLRESCRFDRQPEEIGMGPVEILSGERFSAAEKYWTKEFSNLPTGSLLGTVESTPKQNQPEARLTQPIDSELLQRAAVIADGDIDTVLLAIWSILLSRLSDKQETVIVTGLEIDGERELVAMRLEPRWGLKLKDYIRNVETKRAEAREHARFCIPVLTNPWRLKEHGMTVPHFEFGYNYNALDRPDLDRHPVVVNGLSMKLRICKVDDEFRMEVEYKTARFTQETIEKLVVYLRRVLEEVVDNDQTPIGEIVLEENWKGRGLTEILDAQEEFIF